MVTELLFLALFAHRAQVERTVLIEPEGERLHVVVHVRVTGEKKKRSLLAVSGGNRKRLESLLAERGLDGVQLFTGTATAAVTEMRVKSTVGQGPLEVMVHGVVAAKASLVAIETSHSAEPLTLMVVAGSRPVVSASRGVPRAGSLRTRLGAGDRVSWRMAP